MNILKFSFLFYLCVCVHSYNRPFGKSIRIFNTLFSNPSGKNVGGEKNSNPVKKRFEVREPVDQASKQSKATKGKIASRKPKPRAKKDATQLSLVAAIDALTETIQQTRNSIVAVEAKITEVEKEVKQTNEYIAQTSNDAAGIKEKDYLRTEKEYLRTEKKDLVAKEADLRAKEADLRLQLIKKEDDLREYRKKLDDVSQNILVPDERPFVRGVWECQNFPIRKECPPEKLVNTSVSVQYAMKIINKNAFIDACTVSGTWRCSPVVYTRLSRGGKSTFLRLLFSELRASGKYAPILISFNGDFDRRPGELAKDAIIRSIAVQFIDVKSTEKSLVVCDEEALLAHIEATRGDKAVVLLIDELNRIPGQTPLDSSASLFLKRHFLDEMNRALVFTSHLVMKVEYMTKGTSPRVHELVPLPISKNLKLLRAMDDTCKSLTELEAAIYGYIPSLIFSWKVADWSFQKHVSDESFGLKSYSDDTQKLILGAFVRQLLNGEIYEPSYTQPWMQVLRLYDVFGSNPETNRIQFPIGYIAAILSEFGVFVPVNLNIWYQNLLTYAATVKSGKDWELVVQFAVLIRCIDACQKTKSYSPINFLGRDSSCENLELKCAILPGDVCDAEGVKAWFEDEYPTLESPMLLMASPSLTSFAGFDMFVIYAQPGKKAYVSAIQIKTGDGTPDTSKPVSEWIDRAYLMQGAASESPAKRKDKWTYLSRSAIENFLGYSLRPLYPGSYTAKSN